jgi:hypothetical protein
MLRKVYARCTHGVRILLPISLQGEIWSVRVVAGFARKRKLVYTAYSVLNISFLTRLSHD